MSPGTDPAADADSLPNDRIGKPELEGLLKARGQDAAVVNLESKIRGDRK